MSYTTSLGRLQHAAKQAPETEALDLNDASVEALMSNELPEVEALLRSACQGPEPLGQAAYTLIQAGGKRVRPLVTLLITSACGGDPKAALPFAAAAELIHSATLLHDDVIDEGELRRGRPAARVTWGNLVSVLAGDLLLIRALKLVQNENNASVQKEIIDALEQLIEGEIAQLHARGREDLGLEGYLEIVRGKTGSLFTFACRAGAHAANASAGCVEAVGLFGAQMGIAFQIIDDVIDIQGDPALAGKRLGADIAEGKTTLPLALALAKSEFSSRNLLAQARSGDLEAAVALAHDPHVVKGCQEAREYALNLSKKAQSNLELLPGSTARELLLVMAEQLIDRHV